MGAPQRSEGGRKELGEDRPGAGDAERTAVVLADERELGGRLERPYRMDASSTSRGGEAEAIAAALHEGRANERRQCLHAATEHAHVQRQHACGTGEGCPLRALDARAELRERAEMVQEIPGIGRSLFRLFQHRAKHARKRCTRRLERTLAPAHIQGLEARVPCPERAFPRISSSS